MAAFQRCREVAGRHVQRLNLDYGSQEIRTKTELSELASWKWRGFSMFAGVGATCFVIARYPGKWRLWTSGLLSTYVGINAAGVRAYYDAPGMVYAILEQNEKSVIVDTALCPALREFEVCRNDDRCNAELVAMNRRMAASGTIDLLRMLDACKQRRQTFGVSDAPSFVRDNDDALGGEIEAYGRGGGGGQRDDSKAGYKAGSKDGDWYQPPPDGSQWQSSGFNEDPPDSPK
ncbi:hypothetical protein M885DRAFT_553007 [Pelagophyceae sp. CCMP2097]|nr:hypothetical protein M885DRAFT_553007 [Pelagophyceae sp. CCMP2097]